MTGLLFLRPHAMKWMRLLGLLAALAGWTPVAGALMPSTPVPGGVVVLDLPLEARWARYENRPLWIIGTDSGAKALVGLALAAKPGRHYIDWEDAGGITHRLAFTVMDKAYPTQKLQVPPKMVDLDPPTATRVKQEQARIREALTHHRPAEGDFPWPLALPAEGPTSSPFGLRRVFNGQSRNPHSGLDIAAPEGAPVRAAAAGRIIERDDFYFNGKTVFVDHGGGLISMYCHLSSWNVEIGEEIEAGQMLGRVGRTGRATGPHLHWGIALNGNLVDPALFIQNNGSGH